MDASRYLPLSTRPHDESGVTGDERATIAQLIEQAAVLTAEREDASEAVERFVRDAGLPSPTPHGGLAALAASVRAGKRLRGRHLADATRALLVLADAVGVDPVIPPEVLGRVALRASTTAAFDRRAVLAGHTVRAGDAGWEFGRGPVIEGTALEITRFLLALSDTAPRAVPRQPPDVSAPMSPDATM